MNSFCRIIKISQREFGLRRELDPLSSGVGTYVRGPPNRPHLAREEIEQLRRSIAMLQPGSLAMTREDAMRLLGELGEVRGRLDRLCDGLRPVLAEEDG